MLPVAAERVESLVTDQCDLTDLGGVGAVLNIKPVVVKALVRAGLLKRHTKQEVLNPQRPYRLSNARQLLADLESKAPTG